MFPNFNTNKLDEAYIHHLEDKGTFTLIEIFESYHSLVSDLICELLLEGRIENKISKEFSNNQDYHAKRE